MTVGNHSAQRGVPSPRSVSHWPQALNAEEARRVYDDGGEKYQYLVLPNIFEPLGLYTGPDAQNVICRECQSPGHVSRNCIMQAIRWRNDVTWKVKKNDRGQVVGFYLWPRARPMDEEMATKIEGNRIHWAPILEGGNNLGWISLPRTSSINTSLTWEYLRQRNEEC